MPVEDIPLEAFPYETEELICTLSVVFPKGYKIPAHETEQLLLILSSFNAPVSFEIIATDQKIVVQYATVESEARYLRGQLKAYFPQAAVIEQEDDLFDIFSSTVEAIDWGPAHEFMRPLALVGSFDPDPFMGLFGYLEHCREGEGAAFQILFKGCAHPWAESILRSVLLDGEPFFEDAPDMVPLAKQKVSAPLLCAVIRTIGSSQNYARSAEIALQLGETLSDLSRSAGNYLIPLPNEEYGFVKHFNDVLHRQSSRLGILLNSKELATLVHCPSASVTASKLERDAKKTKGVPTIAKDNSLVLGYNYHHGEAVFVSVSKAQRLKHTHLIGSTGSGKSNLLLAMAWQDIEQGNGFAVLDPHGDLIEKILTYIPEERCGDVLVIDPADADYPVGFNILSAHTELEKDILSSDLVAAFRKNSTSWGDQMNSVFANAILAFLESSQGGTLIDLRRFLIEKLFREHFLKTVEDPSIRYYWHHEYPLLKTNSIGSILTRLDSFLRPKLIRNMVAQKKSIDFGRLMDEKKIILVKLSQGLIGEENSNLLGTFIVAKLQQAAMGRQAISEDKRSEYFLYIDEFHHYCTPSMAAILNDTRKYKLGLIASHQNLNQLKDSDVHTSILAAYTRICFRVTDTDAKKLEDGFSYFDAKDLQNLATGEAIARIEKPEYDFSLNTVLCPASNVPGWVKETVIDMSRAEYGTPREAVEQLLAKNMQIQAHEPAKEKRPESEKKQKDAPTKPPPSEAEQQSTQPEPPKPQPAFKTYIPPGGPAQHEVRDVTDSPQAKEYIRRFEESQHLKLQNQIKTKAERAEFVATIEASTFDGKGFVDVSLVKGDQRIACEVSVTTGAAWEMHNITKCLAAGYHQVFVCSTNKKTLDNIRIALLQLPEQERQMVQLFNPDELFEHLETQYVQRPSTESFMYGRKVIVNYVPLSPEEAKRQNEEVMRILANAKRDKRKKG